MLCIVRQHNEVIFSYIQVGMCRIPQRSLTYYQQYFCFYHHKGYFCKHELGIIIVHHSIILSYQPSTVTLVGTSGVCLASLSTGIQSPLANNEVLVFLFKTTDLDVLYIKQRLKFLKIHLFLFPSCLVLAKKSTSCSCFVLLIVVLLFQ